MTETGQPQKEVQTVTPDLTAQLLAPDTPLTIISHDAGGDRVYEVVVVETGPQTLAVQDVAALDVESAQALVVVFNTDEAIYSFHTRPIRRERLETEKGSLFVIRLDLPRQWLRMQRRGNFRVDFHVAVEVTRAVSPRLALEGQTVNISASGMLLSLEEAMATGEQTTLVFALPAAGREPFRFTLEAQVVRRFKPEDGRLYMHGLAFQNLTARDQDRLAQCLWQRMKGRVMR